MTNNAKTFRLFISSTFSDFQVEREALQTKVFPEIKKYCSTKGYTFQPIDLRWGVSDEAQLDQKALEMCVKEVQSCKQHDYPNFLIMLGDRYGWVPLPNIIEKYEFEQILQNIKEEDKKYVLSWYYEDANQLPTSYMLKQRKDEYEDYNKWLDVESRLREILQTAVSYLDEDIKRKYFTSATEAEAIEGIISYSQKSAFQQKILKLIPDLEQIDHRNIFGFFRGIEKSSIIENKFVSTDYDKAQLFKGQVQEKLIRENILNVSTSQISKDKLNEKYLDQLIESVTTFLKQQIDIQVSKDSKQEYSDLELEKFQQQLFMNQKLENFLGQEKILSQIHEYICDDNDKALVICGPSGIGKSSIMAKAIEETANKTSKKIVFRFIGATPNSTSTISLLTSFSKELNISFKSIDSQLVEQSEYINTLDNFFNNIMNLDDDIVIFIDAVDQLTNDDQFLWLPEKLPSNIKIVISVLKDLEYDDTDGKKYFHALVQKTSNYKEIESFNQPYELLEMLLAQENRILQSNQTEYFLKQYSQVNTPLYVCMAANQMQYWKSSNIVGNDVTLSLSQKNIVKNFIDNLTSIQHHHKLLVQKVFGYILASKDGLSEYEILELLNTDIDFIKTVAPDTWHENTTQELPVVIWTRLYNHTKPFLSKKKQEGQELLYFFHREFIAVVNNQFSQKDEHIKIIEATQKLIEKNRNTEFNNTRWLKLYSVLLLEHYRINEDEDQVFNYYDEVLYYILDNTLLSFLKYLEQKRDEYTRNDNTFLSKHLIKLLTYISKKYKESSGEFNFIFINNLHHQARQEKDYAVALEVENKNIQDIESLSDFNEIIRVKQIKEIKYSNKDKDIELRWLYLYFEIKNMLGFLYTINKDKECISFNREIHLMFKSFYDKNQDNSSIKLMYYDHINYYAMALQQNSVFFQAIDLLKDSLLILEENYNSDHKNIKLYDTYAKTLYIFSGVAYSVKDKDWYTYFSKSYKVYTELLKYDFLKYSKIIIGLNDYHINYFNAQNLFLQSEPYYKKNIMLWNRQGKKGVEEKIQTLSDELFTKVLDVKNEKKQKELFFVIKRLIEYVFNFDKEYWAKNYVQKLIALGGLLNKSKIDDDQLSVAENLQKEGVDICEKYMDEDNEWYDLYTKNLNNLGNTYTYLNKKEKAFLVSQKNLDISTKLFQDNPEKWFRAYYYALKSMADMHWHNGNDREEKVYRDNIKELESNPLFETVPDVIKNKSTDKKIKYVDYIFKGLLLLGVYFIIKYVIIE